MWWLGDLQGVGKGVFTSYVLTRLLGPHNVAILDPAEIEHGGWNDKIEGKLIVVINEPVFFGAQPALPVDAMQARRQRPRAGLSISCGVSTGDEVRILSPSPAMTFTGTAGLVFM